MVFLISVKLQPQEGDDIVKVLGLVQMNIVTITFYDFYT